MAIIETRFSIAFGDEIEFLSADGSIYNSVGILSESKIVVGYQDDSASKHSKVKIGTVSGTNVVFGSGVEFLSQSGLDNSSSIAILDESTFVVEYQDEGDSGHGTVKVGTVSGISVSFGSEIEYASAGRAAWPSIATLDSTHFVIVYADWNDSRKGKARIGTVSGTTVTFGSASVFYSLNEATTMSVASFDPSGFVVGYRKGNAGDLQGATKIGSVSGTTITFGSETEFTDAVGSTRDSISVDIFDTDKFVVAYKDADDSDHGTVKIGNVSGTSISFGNESEFLSSNGIVENVVKTLDSSHLIVAYTDGFDSNHGTIKIGTVTGTDCTFSNESEFLSNDGSDYIALATINANKLIVAYTDTSDSNHGTVRIGITDGNSIGNLYIFGSDPATSGDLARPLDWLLRTPDYHPQIIGTLDNATTVNIQLWNIANGANTLVSVASSGCYQIGDTGRWAWSTSGLSMYTANQRQYFYMMTADNSDTFTGQFFLELPENTKWIHPRNQNEYLR